MRMYFLLFCLLALSGCSRRSGIPDEINQMGESEDGKIASEYVFKSEASADMLLIVSPYITAEGVKRVLNGSYELPRNEVQKIIAAMGVRENFCVFVIHKGRIIDEGYLSEKFMAEDSGICVLGKSAFPLKFVIHSRELRPIEIQIVTDVNRSQE